ncbi:uncharacterized protein KGF55_002219 [Candida pseudojiufengensis]|uniref:uncharacterized protein n=1 Tax=Candida pseudojiufengensis TaxID=497109 RepID=UPI002223F499|nr:uncharacterized protein KGF55_002219 [Candida pseudojiufengensis]KAI5964277.1 hypothetical protein KGF55_002219 [Candida pseudojiufengensis]
MTESIKSSKEESRSSTSSPKPHGINSNENIENSSSLSSSNQNETLENESKHDGKYREADAGDGTQAHEQHLTGFQLYLTIFSGMISLFLVALDQTIVSTILTIVGDKFNAFEKVGWLTSGFLLSMACLIPSYGKISIAFGRKQTLLVGIVIFEAGSLIAALSNSMDLLIAARVIQGIGGGAVQSTVLIIFTEVVPINKRSLVFASLSLCWMAASALGPILGGALSAYTWRFCFYINLIIGCVPFLILVFFFKPPKVAGEFKDKIGKIDFVGTFFLTSGLILVLLGLTFGGAEFPWRSAAIICLFVIGGLLLICFGVWNFKYSKNQIIYTEFVKSKSIMMAVISAAFNFGFFISNLTYLAIYFQVIHHASPLQSGIDLLPLVVTVAIASMVNSFFINLTRRIQWTMILSGMLAPLGTGLFLLFDENSGLGVRFGVLIVIGISIGLQFQSSLLSAQLGAPKDKPGALIMVTVFLNFMRNVASTITVTIAQLLYQLTGTAYIEDLQRTMTNNFEGYYELKNIPARTLISNPKTVHELPPEAESLVLHQLMKALKNVFYFGLALAVVSFIASLFTTSKKIPKAKDVKSKDKKTDEEQNKEEPNGEKTSKSSSEELFESNDERVRDDRKVPQPIK